MVAMTKIGRPKDSHRNKLRSLFPDWSERTFARYYKAVTQVRNVAAATTAPDGWAKEALEHANSAATRANGSFNVSKFSEMCEGQCAGRIVEWSNEQ